MFITILSYFLCPLKVSATLSQCRMLGHRRWRRPISIQCFILSGCRVSTITDNAQYTRSAQCWSNVVENVPTSGQCMLSPVVLGQCWINVGPPSATLVQPLTNTTSCTPGAKQLLRVGLMLGKLRKVH